MLCESKFPHLISLLEKGKRVQPGILGSAIRAEFDNVKKARELGYSWDSIAESLGFLGKAKLASASFSREQSRRAKKGVVPEKKGKEVVSEKKVEVLKKSPVLKKVGESSGSATTGFNFNDHILNYE